MWEFDCVSATSFTKAASHSHPHPLPHFRIDSTTTTAAPLECGSVWSANPAAHRWQAINCQAGRHAKWMHCEKCFPRRRQPHSTAASQTHTSVCISPKYTTLRIRTVDACADKMREQRGLGRSALGTPLATVLGHRIHPATVAAGCERLITNFRRGKILCHWNLSSAANWVRSYAPLETELNSKMRKSSTQTQSEKLLRKCKRCGGQVARNVAPGKSNSTDKKR